MVPSFCMPTANFSPFDSPSPPHSRSLGGKLGASITELLGVEYMGQLIQFSESQLQTHFGDKTG